MITREPTRRAPGICLPRATGGRSLRRCPPRSACWCLAYLALFLLLLGAYLAWTTLWALGYLPALGLVGIVEMLMPGSHMVSVDYR